MKLKIKPLQLILIVFFILAGLHIYHYEVGYSETIDWELTSQANKQSFSSYQFERGVFTFELTGFFYTLSEAFSASAIKHSEGWMTFYLVILWIGLAGILAVSSFWKRYSFLAVCAVFILFFNFLQLDSLDILGAGPNSKWITILGLVLTVGPAYIFHAFLPKNRLFMRWLIISILMIAFFAFLQSSHHDLYTYWLANATFGLSVFSVLFIFLISEEIIFLILYFITKSKGGTHNEKHFLIFGAVYILYLTLYYLKKAGIIDSEILLFDPFYFLVISTAIAGWSVKYKQTIYDSVNTESIDIRYLFIVLGLICFGFLNLGMVRGNDAAYESFHYLIVYAHLGFGFMFLAYITLNFFTPLAQGLQVYKIAFKERNFPYSSARLGGLAAIAAFFFLSNKEPFELIIGAKNNYLADYYDQTGEEVVSKQYFQQAAAYAWDNHYSNYKLGTVFSREQDLNDAYYRYYRATRRYPSPFAYVNASNRLLEMDKNTDIISLLREGQVDFPDNNEIKNNLALALKRNSATNEAVSLLNEAGHSTWNMANKVNKWSMTLDNSAIEEDFDKGTISVKANILSRLLEEEKSPEFKVSFYPSYDSVNLHTVVYLINANWALPGFDSLNLTDSVRNKIQLSELRKDLIHSYSLSQYKGGNISRAFITFDELQNRSNSIEQAYYLNQLGLLALDQYAPRLALDYFNKSARLRNSDASFNRLIALLELGKWTEARITLTENPKVFESIPEEVLGVVNGSGEVTAGYVYYRWRDFSPSDLRKITSKYTENQNQKIWEKIKNQFIREDDYEGLKLYLEIFKNYINSEEANYIGSLFNGESQFDRDEISKNYFDEEKIYQWLKNKNLTDDEKYNLLVMAIEYNPYASGLLKKYCYSAIDMGLSDYAEFTLVSLYELLPKEEYDTFVNEFDQYKKSKQEESWNF